MAGKTETWHFGPTNTLLVQIPVSVLSTVSETDKSTKGPLYPSFLYNDGATHYRIPYSLCGNIGSGIQNKILYRWQGSSTVYEAYRYPDAPPIHKKHKKR